MWESCYAKEKVDYRLFFLRMLKKWWMLPVFVLAGSVVIGGLYTFFKLVVGPGRLYRDTTLYYCDFAMDEEKEYEWFNHYTWEALATADPLVDVIYDELGGSLSKEEIRSYVSATIESDVRVLYTYTDTYDKELSVNVDEAVQKAVIKFGENQKEFNSISPIKSDDVNTLTDISRIKVLNAFILGGLIGLLASILVWSLFFANDSSVYVPKTMEERYGIPSLTALSMKEFEASAKAILAGKRKVSLIALKEEAGCLKPVTEKLAAMGYEVVLDSADEFFEGKAYDNGDTAVVVAQKAAAHNGRRVERILEQAKRTGIKVTATVLTGEDTAFINHFYKY